MHGAGKRAARRSRDTLRHFGYRHRAHQRIDTADAPTKEDGRGVACCRSYRPWQAQNPHPYHRSKPEGDTESQPQDSAELPLRGHVAPLAVTGLAAVPRSRRRFTGILMLPRYGPRFGQRPRLGRALSTTITRTAGAAIAVDAAGQRMADLRAVCGGGRKRSF